MTKNLLTIILFILTGTYTASSQSYLINQNFSTASGTTPPTGWTNNILSGSSTVDNWFFGKHPKFYFAPPFDNNYAIFDSYNGGSAGGTATNGMAENVALESPSINTSGRSNLYFSFDFMELYNGGIGYLDVSINGGSSWSTFATFTTTTSVPSAQLYNFGSYTGYTAFKFRFRWDNSSNYTYSGYLAIDNVKLFERLGTDVTITDIAPMYDKSCPNASQSINLVIKNEGTSSVSNIPVEVQVTGAITTTLNYTYTGTLTSNTSVNVTVGTINTTTGGAFNFKAITNYVGDNNILNDTFKASRLSAAIAGNPTAIDGAACQRGSRVQIGATSSPGDSTFWYAQASGSPIIGQGNPFLTPPINGTTTFYAQNARLFNNDQWAFQGPYRFNGIQYSGSYFNVTASNEILIDSFWQHFAYAGNYRVSVYYKSGSYSGFEANQTAWTLHETKTVTTSGYGHMVGINLTKPLNVPVGSTYGFYILVDGLTTQKCITFKIGQLTFNNADVSVYAGTVSSAQFNGVSAGYCWDGRIFYRKLCLSNKVAVKAVIKPSPIGASLTTSTPFQGKVKIGDAGSPDLVEIGKTNTYEFLPPTGYANGNHMTTWFMSSVTARTSSGTLVPPTAYTYTPIASGAPATIAFTGSSTYLDSMITFYFKFQDLGPHFCDSTVKRTLRVVPTPKPNFEFPNPICDGSDVVFNNLTTIHSGNSSYKWYFGDGDSADVQNPVHLYKTYGCYTVRLIATSSPYGIIKDTSIQVCITEVPVVKFKVTNACEGTDVRFINQTAIGSGTLSYTWIYGDNTPNGTIANPTHRYAVAGGYKVTLKVSANGCESVLTKNAYQFAKPLPNFTAPIAPICSQTEMILPNTSTIAQGDFGSFWTYGDGNSSTLNDGYNTYDAAGSYNVKLKVVSEFGCTDEVTKQVVIKPSPSPSFLTNKLCSGEPTRFVNTTVETIANPIYTWNMSDNSSYTTKDVNKTWSNEGNYSATLKAEFTNGCIGSVTKDFDVLIQPIADFEVQDICSGETANFVNKTVGSKGNINYLWDLGTGPSTDAAPKRLYNPATTQTYTIRLVASYVGGCADTATDIITVSQSPTCDFSVQNQGYLKYKFIPSNTTYTRYDWFFGEGGSEINAVSPSYQYLYTGGFNVRMVATNQAGCECEITKRISANTSVNSVKASASLNIYPNPNTGEFTVSSNSTSGMKIEVYNLLGSKILSQSTTENTAAVSLGDVAKGIYLVKVTINGVTSTTKITVMN